MYLTSTSCMCGCKAFMKRSVTSGVLYSVVCLHSNSIGSHPLELSRLQCIFVMRIMSCPAMTSSIVHGCVQNAFLQFQTAISRSECCFIGCKCPFHGLAVVKEASSIGKAVQWRPEICETNPYALLGNPPISGCANDCSN